MYKSKFSYSQIPARPIVIDDKRVNQRAIDNMAGNEYSKNACGFIRSDFAILSQSNDEREMQRVLARMQEINPEPNPDRPFEEIVREIKPRWCQLPAELDRFEQYCLDNAIEYYKKYLPEEETPVDDSSPAPASE